MKCLQKLAKIKDDKNFFVVMVSTFLFGLIAHGYCYFNLFYSFDALVSISQYSNIVWQISLGRFLQAIYLQIRGGFYVPSLVGFLSLLFIGLSAYFVLRLLDIKNRFLVCLICGILTINITVILLNATFLPWLDIDMFSLLSAVVGVCCIRKFRKGGVIAAPLFFFVSWLISEFFSSGSCPFDDIVNKRYFGSKADKRGAAIRDQGSDFSVGRAGFVLSCAAGCALCYWS